MLSSQLDKDLDAIYSGTHLIPASHFLKEEIDMQGLERMILHQNEIKSIISGVKKRSGEQLIEGYQDQLDSIFYGCRRKDRKMFCRCYT